MSDPTLVPELDDLLLSLQEAALTIKDQQRAELQSLENRLQSNYTNDVYRLFKSRCKKEYDPKLLQQIICDHYNLIK